MSARGNLWSRDFSPGGPPSAGLTRVRVPASAGHQRPPPPLPFRPAAFRPLPFRDDAAPAAFRVDLSAAPLRVALPRALVFRAPPPPPAFRAPLRPLADFAPRVVFRLPVAPAAARPSPR